MERGDEVACYFKADIVAYVTGRGTPDGQDSEA